MHNVFKLNDFHIAYRSIHVSTVLIKQLNTTNSTKSILNNLLKRQS